MYLQKSQSEKNILRVEVSFVEYSSSIASNNTKYELTIIYSPLSWIDLVNSFQLSQGLYLLLNLCISAALILGAALAWMANKFICRKYNKYPPSLKFGKTFRLTFVPQLLVK